MTRRDTGVSLAGALMLAAAAGAHAWLEASMATHMLVELPAITAGGWLSTRRTRFDRWQARFDAHGLTALSWAMLASAYWMVPRALELATTAWQHELAKFATLFVAGALLPGGLQRANRIIQVFFLGNFCAMTAIAGMLYQDQPRQLCNVYSIDDQSVTGIGLVCASCALALLWCIRNYAAFVDPGTPARCQQRHNVQI